MTNKEFYKATFSQVHASQTVDPEAICRIRRKKSRGFRTVTVLAAVLVVLAGLSTAAVAGNWFGLRELLLPERQEVRYPTDPETGIQPVETVDVIGLSGWADSPEARALAEWQDFLNSYDPDGEIVAEIGNEPTGFEETYGQYQVYTQEMADKLEEIVETYGLKLHQVCDIISHEELAYRVGGEFLRDGHGKYWAYMYEDGTFQFDGDVRLEEFDVIDYQLRRAVKGTFDEVRLNISDVDDYREQPYETASGETVLLALGSNKALIFGDFPDCFVTVNVLAGSGTASAYGSGLTMEQLEKIADGIDFSVLKTVQTPDMRGDSVPEEPADSLYERTGIPEADADAFRAEVQGLVYDQNWDDLAALFLLPADMTAGGETRAAETAEEIAAFLAERAGGERAQLMADLDLAGFQSGYVEDGGEEQFIADSGAAGTVTGALWFVPVEGALRILTLQGEGWAVRPAEFGIRAE